MVDLPAAGVVAAGAWAYLRGVRRLGAGGRRWPAGRSAAWSLGLLVAAVATQPPLAAWAGERLSGHVLQHVLVGMVAPLLLASAAPITLFLRAWPARGRRLPVPAALAHPLVGLGAFTVALVVTAATPVVGWAAGGGFLREAAHAALHAGVFAAGALLLWPLVSPDPIPGRLPPGARVLVVVLTVPLHAVMGVSLLSAERPLAGPAYPSLSDQRTAGGLLWVAGDLVGLAATGVVVARWMAEDERAAAVEDRLQRS